MTFDPLQAGPPCHADGSGHSVALPTLERRAVGEVLPAHPRWPQHHPHRALCLREGVRPRADWNQQTR